MPDCLAIITVPKAGTYLMSEVAKLAGWHQTYWHAREDSFEDYSAGEMEDRRHRPQQFRQPLPLSEMVPQVPPHAFFVGHIPCNPATVQTLAGCRKILLVRELRAALVSRMRFERRLRRSKHFDAVWRVEGDQAQMTAFLHRDGASLLQAIFNILPWERQPGVLTVRFEDLLAPTAALGRDLGALLGEAGPLPEAMFRQALAADTLTKSPEGPVFDAYWSPEAEAEFQRIGGVLLNQAFGYPG